MAYKALYRKYRPQTFDGVVGQHFIVQTLKNAVETGRIAHAYLFCGPRGTGKTSIAKIFARALNCTSEHKPCLECDNCRMSLDGSHPDIYEIDAASNNGVDEVRSLIERVDFAPMEGRYKIYIIDEVHMMTTGAFNALLKTIEEPPAHVIFIFATTEPDRVLPTILSRCQRYDFAKVSTDDIAQYLKTICQSENVEIDDSAAQLIAQLADGGMRDSLSILDQCISYEPEHISENHIRDIYGIVMDSDITELIMEVASDSVEQAIGRLHQFSDEGMDLKRFTASCISLLKDSLLMDVSRQTTLIDQNRKDLLDSSLQKLPSDFKVRLLNSLMELYRTFNYASNVLDYLDTAFLEQALFYKNRNISRPDLIHSDSQNMTDQTRRYEIDSVQADHSDPESEIKQPVQAQSDQKTVLEKSCSDVSRETISTPGIPYEQPEEKDPDYIALLTGCEKALKTSDQEQISHMNEYMKDMKTGRYASKLRNTQVFASSENYMILAVPSSSARHILNDLQKDPGFISFIAQVFKKPKRIFPIESSQIKPVAKEFAAKKKSSQLPPAPEISLLEIQQDHKTEQTQEEFLKEIFPDLIIED